MPPTGSGGRGGGGCERIALTRSRLASCALLPLPSLLCREASEQRFPFDREVFPIPLDDESDSTLPIHVEKVAHAACDHTEAVHIVSGECVGE